MGSDGRPLDTSADADLAQIVIYRQLGGAARVAAAFRLGTLAKETALAGIRRRHPDYTEASAERALRRLRLGDALVQQVYPDEEFVDP